MNEPQKIRQVSCVGGPMCGLLLNVTVQTWTQMVPDPQRRMLHTYERRTPNDRAYYFTGSRPLYRLADGDR